MLPIQKGSIFQKSIYTKVIGYVYFSYKKSLVLNQAFLCVKTMSLWTKWQAKFSYDVQMPMLYAQSDA